MSVRCFVRTTPISKASATARSLTDGFEPPASRIRSARSRSRLRTLIEGSGVARRGIGSTKFAVSFSPRSHCLICLRLSRRFLAFRQGEGNGEGIALCSFRSILGEAPVATRARSAVFV